jgi:hypothetical protein
MVLSPSLKPLPFEKLEPIVGELWTKWTWIEGPALCFRIYPLLWKLKHRFQQLYLPHENISVEESLTVCKGCLCFKQDILLKAAKFGVKSYELSGPSLFTQGRTWKYRTSLHMQRQITLQQTWSAWVQMLNTAALLLLPVAAVTTKHVGLSAPLAFM